MVYIIVKFIFSKFYIAKVNKKIIKQRKRRKKIEKEEKINKRSGKRYFV